MLIFPQLSTFASVQYPIQKQRSERTIVNLSEDGRLITLADTFASEVRWTLKFNGLTDQEALNLTSFFDLCEGSLQPFLFLDPTENLLSYSEDLTQPSWQLSSLLTLTHQIDDPFGTDRATRVLNNSLAALTITQTVAIPGSIYCAFSVYLRSQYAGFQLIRDDGSNSVPLPVSPTPSWQRFSLNTAYASSISTSCDFSISIPPGVSLDVFGLQLDAQPFPGTYVTSLQENGVYPGARFDTNQLTVVGTGPGQSNLQMSILSKASQ